MEQRAWHCLQVLSRQKSCHEYNGQGRGAKRAETAHWLQRSEAEADETGSMRRERASRAPSNAVSCCALAELLKKKKTKKDTKRKRPKNQMRKKTWTTGPARSLSRCFSPLGMGWCVLCLVWVSSCLPNWSWTDPLQPFEGPASADRHQTRV